MINDVVAGVGQRTVAGTVLDGETGEPLAGATVALAGSNRGTSTDASGRYALSRVSAGNHEITFRFVGYAPRSLTVFLPPQGRLDINVSLLPEPIHLPPIKVQSSVLVRGVDGDEHAVFPDRGSTIGAVRNHPLLAEPDVLQALGGGEVVLSPESPSGVHVRGAPSDQTAYLLDGIPVFSPYHVGGLFSSWNPDALARIDLSSSAPSPAEPHFLSGTAAAVTRTPGSSLRAQGSVTTTHARLTIDGPLGVAGVSYLLSVRSGFPDGLAPRGEETYLQGENGDWLAKLEAPALGGRLRLLGYNSENEVSAAAEVRLDGQPSQSLRRHAFEWASQSLGAEWTRILSGTTLRLLGWSASGSANSAWVARPAPLGMATARHDLGLLAVVEHGRPGLTSSLGIRLERLGTSYRIEPDSAAAPWGLSAQTLIAAPFVQQRRSIGGRTELDLGASFATARRRLYFGPRALLRWQPAPGWTLTCAWARSHQFAQSLRNAESIVANVFPVDLYVGSGSDGIPVARSDQGVIAAEFNPRSGLHFGVQAYARDLERLVLVAPASAAPFATGDFAVGSGTARGAAFEVAASSARLGLVASYGFQRLRLDYGTSSYVPNHGARHLIDGGVIVFPGSTWSIRFGIAGALERRTTSLDGGLEWEAPNLIDRGSEFAGSPGYGGTLGGSALPPYLRADLGARKTWSFDTAGRRRSVALFGTITNLLGRRNVLTYAIDPATGRPVAVEMRPLAPLVVGLDWRY